MNATPALATLGPALQRAGIERPALVLDHAAFMHNLAWLHTHLPSGYARRIADKSLAAPELLAQTLQGLHSQRTMSFHLPLTRQVLQQHPDLDVLMGKPMPVGEAARFIKDCPQAAQVCWLVDSLERLAQYRQIATQGAKLRVALEVDIGLGRGGFADVAAVAQAVKEMGDLQLQGLMGYEAHVSALPGLLGGGTTRAMQQAQERLADFVAALPPHARQIVNTGGSTTNLMLPASGVANELTVGSAAVKPSDFDQPCNQPLRPALYIATPVLKRVPHGVPAHPRLSNWLRRLRLIGAEVAFIYGGKWMARPVYPPGLKPSPFFGSSSNQQGFVWPSAAGNADWVVLRPTQSEAVIQH
ncbi:MAG: alanine racemase, partial [Brachymonas sp.]|nr:alanine racemase [Brachymonas sp.]